MELGSEEGKVKSSWDMFKSKERNKKKKKDGTEAGCWVKLSFIGSCISSRSKVDSSVSGTSTQFESKSTNDTSKDQPAAPVVSSSTTSNTESNSSTSKLEEELKVASRLRKFTFNDLKFATRNFRPESLLGEGGFGCVFKGWVEENGTAPVKPGTGLTVAVKTLNHDGLQGHKEWLTMQAERVGSSPNARNGVHLQAGLLPRNGHQQRSLSIPNGSHASPYHYQYPRKSPKVNGEACGAKHLTSHVSLQSGKCLKMISSYASVEEFSVMSIIQHAEDFVRTARSQDWDGIGRMGDPIEGIQTEPPDHPTLRA
ncbi:hypothetical protein SADUNF_Sadunf10G0031600 [Salix dunnii]|uniref:Protein kinase domain-containing protein n=1 Tax=Salix dunnii TaxID=1413687 RepID=A0A835JRY9_9ROSI|nr:hypothetical protein SADUNF_Sadunf10G0031600 [Salix dunnii]